jgi:hypothetical protein
MSDVQDLLLSDDYDLDTADGDLVTGPGDDQAAALLLLTDLGEWKESPLVGIGLRRYQSGPFDQTQRGTLQRAARLQFEKDGFTVRSCNVSADAELDLDAYRA